MLRNAPFRVSALLTVIVTSAAAAPVAYLWHDGVVATTPYYTGGFVPSTNQGVNNAGLVAGSLLNGNQVRTAATWDSAAFTPLASLTGYNESTANGVNDSGVVVGASIIGGRQQPTIWSGGIAADLGNAPGYTSGAALAVNSTGQAVGLQYTALGYDAALWNGSSATVLPGLSDAKQTEATAINSVGLIAGFSGFAAVVWRDGAIEALPGCNEASSALAINSAGQVAGRCGANAVVWTDGVMTSLGPDLAVGITDSGDAVGRTNSDPLASETFISTTSGLQYLSGFAWSQPFAASTDGYIVGFGDPVPEPASAAICALGLASYALLKLRVRRR